MAKHLVFKTHRSHKVLMGAISVIVLLIGILLGKNLSYFSVSDTDFKTFTVVLLFILNLIIIVLILILAEFLIDLKDSFLEGEREIIREEERIKESLAKKAKRK